MPTMRIFFRVIIVLLLIGLLGWFIIPIHQPGLEATPFSVVLSSDSLWTPETRQEILVYPLSDSKKLITHETGLKILARITASNFEENSPASLEIPLGYREEGSYSADFSVPEGWLNGTATIEIFQTGHAGQLLHKCEAQIGKDIALAVLPPDEEIFAGSWVNFKIAAINRKSSLGQFKVPVRVRLRSPSGCLTINRVIQTDLDGLALFTTHFHESMPEGLYRFEFSYGNELLQLELFVQSSNKKNNLLSRRIKNKIQGILPISAFLKTSALADEDVCQLFAIMPLDAKTATSTTGLSNVQIKKDEKGETTAILSYDCPASNYRQIEMWQNGQAIYTSELPLEAGTISIPLVKAISSAPLRFKLWFLKTDELMAQDQTLATQENNVSVMGKYFLEADTIFPKQKNTLPYSTLILSRQSLTSIKQGRNSQKSWSGTHANRLIRALNPPGTVEPDSIQSFLLGLQSKIFPGKRFFLVDNELMLNRYRFSSLRVWLDPRKFFSSVLAALRKDRASVDFVVGEAECRALRFPFLPMLDQAAELEKLEGLLIPLSEFHSNKSEINGSRQANLIRVERAIRRLSSLIHVSETLLKDFDPSSADLSKIGPFSPVLPGEISITSLLGSLKSGGKVNLVSEERSISLNLLEFSSVYRNKSYSGEDNKLIKLVNTRSTPVLVELEFAITDQ